MKFKVKGIAMNRKTRKQVGRVRIEIINTKTNSLFKNIFTNKGIETKYELFWNDLNPNSKEIVKVISIVKMAKKR